MSGKSLLEQSLNLGEDKEAITLSPEEYDQLDWTPLNHLNVRNWVDLWDALNLQWYFYLRAKDMYRTKSEWFKDDDGV